MPVFLAEWLDTFNSLSNATKISILIAIGLTILLLVLIIVTIKVLRGTGDDEDYEDEYEEERPRRKARYEDEYEEEKPRKKVRYEEDDEDEPEEDSYESEEEAEDESEEEPEEEPEEVSYKESSKKPSIKDRLSQAKADEDDSDDDDYTFDEEEESEEEEPEEAPVPEKSDEPSFDETVRKMDEVYSAVNEATKAHKEERNREKADKLKKEAKAKKPPVSNDPTIKIDTKKVKEALKEEAESNESDNKVALDSAFDIKETKKEEKKIDSGDSAFDIKPGFENPYVSPVNPVNAVSFNTVNTGGKVKTSNVDAGIDNEEELEEYLSKNPVPKKKKKKTKKKDEIFDEKFGPTDFEIEGAKYFWYNSQDIAECKRKEDMYFHCHYFDNPERAVIPLITEMYDCAFVKTEELQYIAYGIQFKPLSFKEILNSDGDIGFDKTQATKEPSESDKKLIYKKWCEYVDSFLLIIVINASEDVKEFIKEKLYEYGKKDADTLIYNHY